MSMILNNGLTKIKNLFPVLKKNWNFETREKPILRLKSLSLSNYLITGFGKNAMSGSYKEILVILNETIEKQTLWI